MRRERLAAVREWLEVGLPRCYFIVPCCEGGNWPPGPAWDEERRRRTRGGRIGGSLAGSQQRQASGDPQPLLAVMGAAKQPVRLHPASSGDRKSVPSG